MKQQIYNPATLNKEVLVLKEIGLEQEEIQYLMYLKYQHCFKSLQEQEKEDNS